MNSRNLFATVTLAYAITLTVASPAMAAGCDIMDGFDPTNEFDPSNVTFRGEDSDYCAGLTGNDSASELNTLWPTEDPGWYLLAKDESPGSAGTDTGTITTDSGDVSFTLTENTASGGASSSGTWTLSWTGEGLPIAMDLAVVLKASDSWGAFRFDDEDFAIDPSTGSGDWEIQFLNGGSKIPAISHFSLWVRDVIDCAPGEPCGGGPGGGGPGGGVPIPAPLALLGLGAALLGWRSRQIR